MARRRATATPSANADTFHVRLNGVDVGPPKTHSDLAVVRAQKIALDASDPVELFIERRSVFGPPAVLLRVERDEDGVVLTTILEASD